MKIPTRFNATLALLFLAALATPSSAVSSAAAPEKSASKKSGTHADDSYATTPNIQKEVYVTIGCLEQLHLLKKPFKSISSETIIKDYIGNLDSMRLFFLESEVAFYRNYYGSSLDVFITNGNLTPAFRIYRDFYEHIEKRIAWINTRLDQPFNLDTTETFVANRSKLDWPTDAAAADRLWENRLKLDLILELLSDGKSDAATAAITPGATPPSKTAKPAASRQHLCETHTLEAMPFRASNAAEIPPEQLATAIASIRKRYNKIQTYLRFEPYEIEEIFLNTIAAQYDPHTSFFSKQSLADFEIAMRNKLIGIGAVLRDEDGYCVVNEIVAGGPLESSRRVKVGDRIVAIAQNGNDDFTDVVGMRINKIVSLLRGKDKTIVRLRISPASDRAAQYTLTLRRAEIKLTTKLAKAAVFEVPDPADPAKTIPIGVIELPAFYGKDSTSGDVSTTSEDVAELIKKLKKHNIRGLVLDLRRNGGGYLEEAVNLTGLFIPSRQPVVQVHSSIGKPERLNTPMPTLPVSLTGNILWDGPLVLLVSKLSASASEIVAGALQDHHRALIVGDEHTHGKGSVQQLIPTDKLMRANEPLGSGVKVTVQKWYLPSGNSIQLKGVAADVPVPSTYSVLPVAESDLQHPLAWDSIPTSLADGKPADHGPRATVNDALLRTLRAASAKRQAELPEFLPLNRTISWMKTREKTRAYPISYTAMLTERRSDESFRDEIRDTYKSMESAKYKTEAVKLDATIEQEKKEAAAKKLAATGDKTSEEPATTPSADGDDDVDDLVESPADTSFDVQQRESLRIVADWLKATR